MLIRMTALPLAAMGALCLAQAGNASAATLSYEETASGITGSGAGTSYFNLPVHDGYTHDLGPSAGLIASAGAPGFSFYDDYIFTVANSTIDSATTEINLGTLSIANLEERIYSIDPSSHSPPMLSNPTGFQTAWSTPITFQASHETGMTTVLSPTTLNGGTYVLEIRGNVTGADGGTYSGVLNLQPVPLPAALPLLFSGLGLLACCRRQRA